MMRLLLLLALFLRFDFVISLGSSNRKADDFLSKEESDKEIETLLRSLKEDPEAAVNKIGEDDSDAVDSEDINIGSIKTQISKPPRNPVTDIRLLRLSQGLESGLNINEGSLTPDQQSLLTSIQTAQDQQKNKLKKILNETGLDAGLSDLQGIKDALDGNDNKKKAFLDAKSYINDTFKKLSDLKKTMSKFVESDQKNILGVSYDPDFIRATNGIAESSDDQSTILSNKLLSIKSQLLQYGDSSDKNYVSKINSLFGKNAESNSSVGLLNKLLGDNEDSLKQKLEGFQAVDSTLTSGLLNEAQQKGITVNKTSIENMNKKRMSPVFEKDMLDTSSTLEEERFRGMPTISKRLGALRPQSPSVSGQRLSTKLPVLNDKDPDNSTSPIKGSKNSPPASPKTPQVRKSNKDTFSPRSTKGRGSL